MSTSFNFDEFDYINIAKNNVIRGIAMKPNNVGMPYDVCLTKNGDWFIVGLTPRVYLTEKMSCLFYLSIKNTIPEHALSASKYNIIKFLLLNQIINNYLIKDLLNVIINLTT